MASIWKSSMAVLIALLSILQIHADDWEPNIHDSQSTPASDYSPETDSEKASTQNYHVLINTPAESNTMFGTEPGYSKGKYVEDSEKEESNIMLRRKRNQSEQSFHETETFQITLPSLLVNSTGITQMHGTGQEETSWKNSTLEDKILVDMRTRNETEIHKEIPFEYKYEEIEKINEKFSESSSQIFKRDSNFGRFSNYAKAQIQSVEMIESINGSIQNFDIAVSDGVVWICYTSTDNKLEIKAIGPSGNKIAFLDGEKPCHFVKGKQKLLYATVQGNKRFITVTKIAEDFSVTAVQVLPTPVNEFVHIESWLQFGKEYLLLSQTHSEDVSRDEVHIYRIIDRQFRFVQKFLILPKSKPHHFQIGKDHFIAFPSFEEVDESRDGGTLIFKFSRSSYSPFQALQSDAASSVSSFKTDDGKVYLVITNYCTYEGEQCNPHSKAIVFKFNGQNFEMSQTLPTVGATESTVMKVQGQTFLAILSSLKGLSFYHFEEDWFTEVFPQMDNHLLMGGLTNLISFTWVNDVYFGLRSVVLPGKGLMIFKTNFLMEFHEESIKWCKEMRSFLDLKMRKIKGLMAHAPLKTRRINFNQDLKIKSLKIESNARVPVFTEEIKSTFRKKLSDLEFGTKRLEEKLMDIENKISKAINVNETVDWPDNLHMSSVVVLAAKANKFKAETVNGLDVPSTDQLIPFRDENVHINLNTKTFMNIDISHRLLVENLNGYPLQSFVTLNGNHLLTGHVIFEGLSTPSIKVGGSIDGLEMNRQNLLLRNGITSFKGSLTCTDATISNLNTPTINGIDIHHLMQNTATRNSSIEVKDLKINGNLVYPGDLTVGLFMNKNLRLFAEDVLSLNVKEPQVITGSFVMDTIKTVDIYIRNTLNSIPFSESVFINLPIKMYHLSKARFKNLVAKSITIDKSINEIKVIDRELDLMTLRGDQIITGQKAFAGMHLENSNPYDSSNSSEYFTAASEMYPGEEVVLYKSTIQSREEIKRQTYLLNWLRILRTILLKFMDTKPSLLNPSRIIKNLIIENTVNKVLAELQPNLKVLQTDLDSDALDLTSVMQIFLEEYIDPLNDLSSHKALPETLLNDLKQFYSTLYDTLVKVEKLIMVKKNLIATLNEKINLLDSRIRKEFETTNLFATTPQGSLVTGLIAGYDLRKIPTIKRPIPSTLNNTTILEKVKAADLVIFMKNLFSPNINRVNLQKLIEMSVPISAEEANLNLVFDEIVAVQRDFSTPVINNEIVSDLAKLSSTNVFEKEMEFREIISEGNVTVKGRVNGYNVQKLSSEMAKVSGKQTFTVPVYFDSIKTKRVHTASASLGDIPIEDFVLRRTGDVYITGQKRFEQINILSPVVSIGDLHTKKLGKMDLTETAARRTIEGDLKIKKAELKRLQAKGNMVVRRGIRNFHDPSFINLTKLYDDAISVRKNIFINGSLLFKGKVFIDNLKFTESFDGISARTFKDGLLVQDKNQTLVGENFFPTLRVKNLILKDNYLQGINLDRLFNATAKIDEETNFPKKVYMGKVTSQKDISVNGLVQGWNLTRDAILASDSPTITGAKTFLSPVHVNGNFNVLGVVNGIDIGEVCKYIFGELKVKGDVEFGKHVFADRVISRDERIPDDPSNYWIVDRPAVLEGDMVFDSLVADGIQIQDNFNDNSVREILEGPLPSDCDNKTIKGKWFIDNLYGRKLIVKELKVDKLNEEDSSILNKVFLDTIEQSFPDDFEIGNMEVKDSLVLDETLNGCKMCDFCSRDLPCHITGQKIFESMHVLGDIGMSNDSRINNISIKMMRSLYNPAPVDVVIEGSVHASSLNVTGTVQGEKFSPDTILTLSRSQTMNGSLVVSDKNGLEFKASDLIVLNQRFLGLNLTSLRLFNVDFGTSEIVDADNPQLETLLGKYKYIAESIVEVHSILRDQPITFSGWEVTKEFNGVSAVIPVDDSKESSIHLASLINPEGVLLINYIAFSKTYRSYAFIKVNCTTDARGFHMRGALFVATSVDCANKMNLTGIQKISPGNIGVDEDVFSYLWKITSNGVFLHAAIATSETKQILSMRLSGRNCIFFVSKNSVQQNIFCDDGSSLILQQSFSSERIIRALHLDYDRSSFLIIGTKSNFQNSSKIKILEFNNKSGHYDSNQNILAEGLIWICEMKFKGSVLLATVHEPFRGSDKGRIDVYKSKKFETVNEKQNILKFVLEESVFVSHPHEATFLESPAGDAMLLVLNKFGRISRFIKKGFGKFQQEGALYISGARSISSWVWERENSYNLAVSIMAEETKVKLLKPLYKGWRGFYKEF